jgi:hypothetical protein
MISPVDTRAPNAPANGAPGAPAKSGRAFALIFGVLAVIVTLGTVALAAIAPSFNMANAPTVPSGWSQVYNADLSAGDTSWDVAHGCTFQNGGLDARPRSSPAICLFQPSRTTDYLGSGFLLQVTLEPSGQVAGNQVALFELGTDATNGGKLSVDQSGTFTICTDTCADPSASEPLPPQSTDTFAWHGVAANTITLRWLGPGTTLDIFANGQSVTSVKFDLTGSNDQLALGAVSGDEAIFTHVTLYSAR